MFWGDDDTRTAGPPPCADTLVAIGVGDGPGVFVAGAGPGVQVGSGVTGVSEVGVGVQCKAGSNTTESLGSIP
jgi:hypothetical protein